MEVFLATFVPMLALSWFMCSMLSLGLQVGTWRTEPEGVGVAMLIILGPIGLGITLANLLD